MFALNLEEKDFLQNSSNFQTQKYLEFNHTKLIAKIRKENIASIKCFSSCGFSVENEDENFYFYKKLGGIKKL